MQAGSVSRLASVCGTVYPETTIIASSSMPQASVDAVIAGREPWVVYISVSAPLSLVSRMFMLKQSLGGRHENPCDGIHMQSEYTHIYIYMLRHVMHMFMPAHLMLYTWQCMCSHDAIISTYDYAYRSYI